MNASGDVQDQGRIHRGPSAVIVWRRSDTLGRIRATGTTQARQRLGTKIVEGARHASLTYRHASLT